ncbi:MipA/OmpV family protein [Paraglaciecola aquimarina]|uniref:MipA/OmpV family protein n=1 Tax=Paraglaciecola algarum TaxID=3050085 RepID=A0ABS9D700_9ALTE|nr:MipA/OmpV family protein [Paraglaciecola sp. G1-23]MCF2948747.1 MipA/OmpV family protein [Paraglaciecola sp. G1-23]
MLFIVRCLIFLCLISQAKISFACSEQDCIKTDSWQLGLAIGLGIKTNPLVDGDNIPLVILPDVAWYAEKAYFDNGELGYQWINQDKFAVESFVSLDQERAFFSFFHPANLLTGNSQINAVAPPTLRPSEDERFDEHITSPVSPANDGISIDQISKRKWAINAGLRWHYFLDNMELTASWQNDISGVHQGSIVELAYSIKWAWQKTQFNTQIGANWKSQKLLNYYYGIDQEDIDDSFHWYVADAGIETYLALAIQRPINDKWLWLTNVSFRQLPDSMYLSPIVKDSNIKRVFMGVAYRF